MSIFSKLRPLQTGERIANPDGSPSLMFQRLWQQLIGNPEFLNGGKQDADPALDSLSDMTGTGLVVRSADDTFIVRSLAAGTGITIGDPSGVAGNPTISSTVTGYTAEAAQDDVGGILVDSSTIDFTYNDATPSITAAVIAGSIGPTQLESTAVTPGSYTIASITVDADGRLTAASTGTATGYRPMVDGADPPVFIINGENDLIMTEI